MSPDATAEEPSEEELLDYPTTDVIKELLSSSSTIPQDLRRRLHDAHCHPTDHPNTLAEIDPTASGSLCAMSTRPTDQSLVDTFAKDNPDNVVPFFGYHPWFAYLFSIDGEANHYQTILKPTASEDFISHLPLPLSWEDTLSELRNRLQGNPKAQVGEIGLDKSFRLPTHTNGERDVAARRELSPYRTSQEHQLRIFTDQCKLAGEFGRAISVHGVQAHGLVFAALQSLWKGHEKKKIKSNTNGDSMQHKEIGMFPPRVCIHSASLSPEAVKQYLQPSVPSKIYFSFSTVINARYGQKLLDLISLIPDDRILIESDWHSEGSVRRHQLHDIARIVISTKKWSIEQGVEMLERNFYQFVYGR